MSDRVLSPPLARAGGRPEDNMALIARLLPLDIAVFLVYLTVGAPLPVIPLFVHDRLGFDPLIVGIVIGAQAAATLLARPLAGGVSDRARHPRGGHRWGADLGSGRGVLFHCDIAGVQSRGEPDGDHRRPLGAGARRQPVPDRCDGLGRSAGRPEERRQRADVGRDRPLRGNGDRRAVGDQRCSNSGGFAVLALIVAATPLLACADRPAAAGAAGGCRRAHPAARGVRPDLAPRRRCRAVGGRICRDRRLHHPLLPVAWLGRRGLRPDRLRRRLYRRAAVSSAAIPIASAAPALRSPVWRSRSSGSCCCGLRRCPRWLCSARR